MPYTVSPASILADDDTDEMRRIPLVLAVVASIRSLRIVRVIISVKRGAVTGIDDHTWWIRTNSTGFPAFEPVNRAEGMTLERSVLDSVIPGTPCRPAPEVP